MTFHTTRYSLHESSLLRCAPSVVFLLQWHLLRSRSHPVLPHCRWVLHLQVHPCHQVGPVLWHLQFAEEAVGGPLEDTNLGHNTIILGPKCSPHEPELAPFFGLYHRIGILNGKPIWKSQHQSFSSNGFSPDQTAYVWYSRTSNHYLLSRHCFNEDSMKIQLKTHFGLILM